MKVSMILMLFAIITVSCEGPTGPQGLIGIQGEQGEIGPKGISKIMFDHFVVLEDYYRSAILTDAFGGVWMVGIKHDSIKVTSDVNVWINLDSVQVWQPIVLAVEFRDGEIGVWDPLRSWYLGKILRIVVIN